MLTGPSALVAACLTMAFLALPADAGAQLPVTLDPVPDPNRVSAASQHDVAVVDFEFEPPTLETAAGSTVVWQQTGNFPHSVTADDGSFDSHPQCSQQNFGSCMQNGDTFSRAFPAAGTFAYYCKIHGGPGGEGMAGVIEVKAAEVTTTTAPSTGGGATPPSTAPTTASTTPVVAGVQQAAAAGELPATGASPTLGAAALALIGASGALRRRNRAMVVRPPAPIGPRE